MTTATTARNPNAFELYESARYAAVCTSCGSEIEVGAPMLYRRSDRKAHHTACHVRAATSLAAALEAANTATVSAENTASISDGFYTVVRADGTHITFRIRTNADDADFAPGARVIATLTGQDNESDYMQWGFLNGATVNVWKSRRDRIGDWAELATALVSGDWKSAGIAYARQSGNCYICNRRLTTPESIEAGIGPVCAGRI